MSSLPGELIDAILDWSSTHPPSSLAAYALVSRQWLPRSRHHHFASISLTRDRSTDNVKPFLHLVASPLVTFLSSIRDVQLYHRSSYGIPVLSAGDIILLLSKFGIHPTRLTLDCHFTQLGMQGSHRNSFTSLTHLHLSLYGEVPLEKLFSYLSAFPSLKSLSLGIRQSGSELGWISMQLQHNFTELPPSLRELDVHQPNILRCLSSVDASAQFSTLILRGIRRFHDVTQYLRNSAISTALISLTLDNCVTDAHFDLSRLNSLRHLHIRQHQIWTASAVLRRSPLSPLTMSMVLSRRDR
ncbi:hypothetical protein B0H13DRAFT_1180948 [Mycena leptocephala]|nr:hypothetical protein B0H13DRAFT_1180948 [Mycena leptocephala]